jgi:hypothetical protein
MAIALVRPATSEQRCPQPWPRSFSLTNPSRSRPPAVCSVPNKVIAITRADRPHRSNSHRARPTLDTPSPRVCPRQLADARPGAVRGQLRDRDCTAPFAIGRRSQAPTRPRGMLMPMHVNNARPGPRTDGATAKNSARLAGSVRLRDVGRTDHMMPMSGAAGAWGGGCRREDSCGSRYPRS